MKNIFPTEGASVIVSDDMCDNYDINEKCYDFVYRANYVISAFRFAHRDIQINLLNTFCTAYYGSVTWDFCGNSLDCLDVKYKNAARRIFCIPRHSRSSIVYCLAKALPSRILIHRRYVKFYCNSLLSCNTIKIAKKFDF